MVDDFVMVNCSKCETELLAVNLQHCIICEVFNDACPECYELHTHTAAEIEDAKREMLYDDN